MWFRKKKCEHMYRVYNIGGIVYLECHRCKNRIYNIGGLR